MGVVVGWKGQQGGRGSRMGGVVGKEEVVGLDGQ